MGKHKEESNEKLSDGLLSELMVEDEKTESQHQESEGEVTHCKGGEIGYGTGDAMLGSFVVAPLVVGVWRSTWGIMDLNHKLFPYAQTYIMGIVLHTCFALVRSRLLARSKGAWSGADGGAGRWLLERALSRVYTYIFILANINHWRGGWGLLDAVIVAILPNDSDPHRWVLMASFHIFFYISIAALRSARNLLAPPYFLVTDGKEATYIFTTRFKTTVGIAFIHITNNV